MRANKLAEEVPCFKAELVARLRASIPNDEEIGEARRIFAALADVTRLKVVHALAGGDELCVCDVANALEISISNASHHLRKLRALGLLSHRTDGKWVYYSLERRFAAKLVQRVFAEVAA